jgi:hypothetical protein
MTPPSPDHPGPGVWPAWAGILVVLLAFAGVVALFLLPLRHPAFGPVAIATAVIIGAAVLGPRLLNR